MRFGITIGVTRILDEAVELARYCEDSGFVSAWVGEGRLTSDAIVPLALIANATKRR